MTNLQSLLKALVKPINKEKFITSESKPTIAVILDEFSTECFRPEMNLIPIGPNDIEKALDHFQPDFLLCESAWRGNDYSWSGEIAGTGKIKPRLEKLLNACRERNLPTIFWNKEDPPHFDEFIGSAKHFDIIFTTEERMIPAYRDVCSHDRIFVLPFAAQPKIHNPIQVDKMREHEIAFAGQYFTHKFPERRAQTDYLFSAAMNFDFHIHSREETGDPRYRFPLKYDKFLRGSLSYDVMVEAYKWYKIFLNVNSVHDSRTMCARRVFELGAAKTVVLSAESEAVRSYYSPQAVPMAANEQIAFDILEDLLNDVSKLRKMAHIAWRETMRSHTYANRFEAIRREVQRFQSGMAPALPVDLNNCAVLICDSFKGAVELIDALSYQSTDFTCLLIPFCPADTRHDLETYCRGKSLTLMDHNSDTMTDTDHFVVFRTGYEYGPNYAEDLIHSFSYVDGTAVAKPLDLVATIRSASVDKMDTYAEFGSAAGLAFSDLLTGKNLGVFNNSFLTETVVNYSRLYICDPYNIKTAELDIDKNEWKF